MNRRALAGPLTLVALAVCLAGCRRPAPPPPNERVVSLAPSLTEIVCAVGGRDLLAGRTTACNHPPGLARDIPAVGGFGAPSLERLASVAPTLVLDVDLADESVGEKIERLGLRRERIPCSSLADIPRAIERIGVLLHREPQAAELAAGIRSGVRRLEDDAATVTNRPSVFVEIWHDPLITAGHGSFLSELIGLAGGRNLGDAVERDYFEISQEWVVARNPDVILCFYMAESGSAREQILRRSGWAHVTAVRKGRVYDGFDNDVILRPGPRVLRGIAELRACLRPSSDR